MSYIKIFFRKLRLFPQFLMYVFLDLLNYKYYNKDKLYYGWGIHLYTGKFGSGKTSLAVIHTYEECKQYKQLTVLTNLKLTNFPSWTNILPLNTVEDILNAPNNTIVLIDEIGTIFNSRDFMKKKSVPKCLFQMLSQCRHRNMKILGI